MTIKATVFSKEAAPADQGRYVNWKLKADSEGSLERIVSKGQVLVGVAGSFDGATVAFDGDIGDGVPLPLEIETRRSVVLTVPRSLRGLAPRVIDGTEHTDISITVFIPEHQ
jgi:hypothetical protein